MNKCACPDNCGCVVYSQNGFPEEGCGNEECVCLTEARKEFFSDPLWKMKLPLVVSKTGSRKGLFIFLGCGLLIFIVLQLLSNMGIIGQ
ncbi:MAG: hypothetical protein VW683_00030 [Betaproteobacteria bacterium]|jgi:hypothetical protein